MAPADKESLKMGHKSVKAKVVKPLHVCGQPPQATNPNCPMLGSQKAMMVETMAPATPNWNFMVRSQERKMWMAKEAAAK